MKGYGGLFIFCIIVIAIIAGCYLYKDWTFRFKSELDQFFGKENWECVSKENERTNAFYELSHTDDNGTRTRGKYTNWFISFTNKYGEEETRKITNLTFKINRSKSNIFSNKRFSGKQGIGQQLLEIACELAGEEVVKEIIGEELPENITQCLSVSILYRGNPEKKVYNVLLKEPWFHVDGISAENFLTFDLHDFYIDIFAFDYKLAQLTEQERQQLFDSMKIIERKLLEKYGENASFDIYFNEEYQVEYKNGQLQED